MLLDELQDPLAQVATHVLNKFWMGSLQKGVQLVLQVYRFLAHPHRLARERSEARIWLFSRGGMALLGRTGPQVLGHPPGTDPISFPRVELLLGKLAKHEGIDPIDREIELLGEVFEELQVESIFVCKAAGGLIRDRIGIEKGHLAGEERWPFNAWSRNLA
jgi:hypothetical protein